MLCFYLLCKTLRIVFEVGFGLLAMASVAVLVAVDIRLVSASAFAGVSTNNR